MTASSRTLPPRILPRPSAARRVVAAAVRWGPLVSRLAAAILGGYALATLTSVAMRALPGPAGETVMAGMLASFLVYAGAVVWVFAVRSARRAWAGLMLAALPLAVLAAPFWTGGTA